MRILITGATGFIGRHLINKLSEENHSILAFSRNSEIQFNDKVKLIKVELSNFISYKEEIVKFQPEIFIHLAWQDIPDFSFEKSLLNLKISLELISFVTNNIELCKKIIVSGSCFEYYNPNGKCIEGINEIPKDYFTWAKLSLKSFLEVESKRKNINFLWLRIFYVYGPYQRLASLIPTILNELKKNKLPPIKTPKNANDFIFIDDVIEAIYSTLFNEVPSGVYNLGSGNSTEVLEVCKLSEQILFNKNSLSKELENLVDPNVNSINFWADLDKSKKILNWQPKTNLRVGLQKTWDWIKQNESN